MGVDLSAAVLPALITGAGLLLRCRGGRGLWDILHESVRGRSAARVERERRATLQMVLERLPHGEVRVEDSDGHGGRHRTVISNREERLDRRAG